MNSFTGIVPSSLSLLAGTLTDFNISINSFSGELSSDLCPLVNATISIEDSGISCYAPCFAVATLFYPGGVEECVPTTMPTESPSTEPTAAPTEPTTAPTIMPSLVPTESPTSPINSDSSGGNDDVTLSDGAVAGIVIAVFCLIAAAMAVAYYCGRSKAPKEDDPVGITDVEIGDSNRLSKHLLQ